MFRSLNAEKKIKINLEAQAERILSLGTIAPWGRRRPHTPRRGSPGPPAPGRRRCRQSRLGRRGGEAGGPPQALGVREARPRRAPGPAPPPTHPGALTSSSSQSLRAWYWNRGRPPAPPPPRSRGTAEGAWAPGGLGAAPSSSGPWPPRRRLASGGAGKDREVLILPVKRW